MLELLQKLCEIPAVSGNEDRLRDFIIREIGDSAECRVDPLGSVIALKKGQQRPVKRVVLDAHMDEVGLIITGFNDNGTLTFAPVGGINTEALLARRVIIGENYGVISTKPVHLLKGDEGKKMPSKDSLVIDIGAADKESAMRAVSYGDVAVFDSDFVRFGDRKIKARALDDRVGCAVMLSLIKEQLPFDMYFTFSVQEEVGLRGARATAYSVDADMAIALEATTAVDIAGVEQTGQVCRLGDGVAASFMDGSTLYDPVLYRNALSVAADNNISVQTKRGTSGGNNSGAIHLSRGGVRTLTLSVPCRYLHTAVCVIDERDLYSALDLARKMSAEFAAGRV
jgi:putative aminopeptidase FrvX